ncbi:MAG: hypothetical protein GX301_05205 [Gracilibacteraceae bacterium]|jgi:hypothetical membrane protein|nr:hypothetical protein [Gracilibacteraceae bacterium]
MAEFNTKLIICGMALLLFGIIMAITSKPPMAYIIGGLGLFFVVVGCFVEDDSGSRTE